MKMQGDDSVLNFGDTSFRRKRYMVEFKELLGILHDHMHKYNNSWSRNEISQGDYYLRVLSNTSLFERNEDENLAKRARTLTNSLVKTGLITSSREITQVGIAWLNETIKEPDSFEAIFSISNDNLVFLRQWTKFRLFNPKGNRYFSPFLFTLKFLSKNQNVPLTHFIPILHSIHPDITTEALDFLIEDYNRVPKGEISLTQFIAKHIDEVNSNEEDINITIEQLLSKEIIVREEFDQYFKNGKSQEKGGALYLEFVTKLIQYRKNSSRENYLELYNISKKDTVKKGFGFGNLPFRFSRSKNYTTENFNNDNVDSLLLNGSLPDIYNIFKESKRHDLVKEYGDLTRRLLNLTGIIDFENNILNLLIDSVIEELFDNQKISLVAPGDFKSYENTMESPFFKNITFMEFLDITEEQLEIITTPIVEKYNLDTINDLIEFFDNERDNTFQELLATKFNKDQTIQILDLISKRNDNAVFKMVTDGTNIPTILEYITGIAWYHLSDHKPNLRKSLNLSFDANYLPLSHASGNQGDIEIENNENMILLEATLMDVSNQRRNELEPVIRHATNLAVEKAPKPVQTFFIGNIIDDNVSNIFRACSHINLKHSQNLGIIDGIEIFPITINELITLLEKNKSDTQILKILREEKSKVPEPISLGWRASIINRLIS